MSNKIKNYAFILYTFLVQFQTIPLYAETQVDDRGYDFVYGKLLSTKEDCIGSGAKWITSVKKEQQGVIFEKQFCLISHQLEKAIEVDINTGNVESMRKRIELGLPPHFPLSLNYGGPIILHADNEKQCEIVSFFSKHPNMKNYSSLLKHCTQ